MHVYFLIFILLYRDFPIFPTSKYFHHISLIAYAIIYLSIFLEI